MLLYKYLDRHFIEVFKNLTFKVNDPEKFNDPFEFKPCILPFKNDREKNSFLDNKKVMSHYYESFRKKYNIKSEEDFKSHWKNKKSILAKTMTDAHVPAKEAFESVPVGDFLFILCLSNSIKDSYDEILMWSHYTDKHEGAMLTIDTDFFKTPFFDLKKVVYSKHRPSFHMADYILNPKRVQEQTTKSMYVKSIAWKYENEYRLFFAQERCRSTFFENKKFYTVDIYPTALQEVTLGCKMGESERKEALTILKDEKFRHVRIKRAVLAGNRYQIVNEKI